VHAASFEHNDVTSEKYLICKKTMTNSETLQQERKVIYRHAD